MKFRMNGSFAYGLIVLGAAFWGVTGLFVQSLYGFGFSPWEVVAVRLAVSSILLFILLLTFARPYLRIKSKHLPYFFGLGVFSIALFNWCYFAVMERASLSIAVIFVYTSPIFAAVIARLYYQETITVRKSSAIILTIIGCGFVIGFFPIGNVNISVITLLLGIFSGVFCSLYSIIGKHVSRLYHPLTVTFYSMLCGSLLTVPTSSVWENRAAFLQTEVWMNILGISIISTILAYILYTAGLKSVESSKAAILSAFELIVSVFIGVVLFGDLLNGWQWFGFLLVICSLFLTVYNRKAGKRDTRLGYRKKQKAYY
ncbi:DMT family transporter [Sediminibacillus massiliensis]|uniref:DMT family transporter n=1 Tax=Sediminibacillus massiliensis TaxID=1926277 RepID=UPI00098872BB|nr:DMT family transporter [Sediminibacillus massiliensis]